MAGSTRSLLRLLVFGDSVLWGQGLPEAGKIHNLVATALGARSHHLEVQTTLYAHSGAILGDPADQTVAMPLSGPFAGEVPVTHPTVFQQVYTALGEGGRDTTADVVILGGGINDVHLVHILNPLDNSLDERIDTIFAPRIKALLELCAYRFPMAKIIMTGYYPFFSEQTDASRMESGMQALGLDERTLPGFLGKLVFDALTDAALIERAQRFCDRAHACIRSAIHELTRSAPELVDRLFFADPAFKPEHAMFAPQSLLYGIQLDLTAEDPLAAVRAAACAEHARSLPPVETLACPRASAGHPNAEGARRYAEAVLLQLRYGLPKLFMDEE